MGTKNAHRTWGKAAPAQRKAGKPLLWSAFLSLLTKEEPCHCIYRRANAPAVVSKNFCFSELSVSTRLKRNQSWNKFHPGQCVHFFITTMQIHCISMVKLLLKKQTNKKIEVLFYWTNISSYSEKSLKGKNEHSCSRMNVPLQTVLKLLLSMSDKNINKIITVFSKVSFIFKIWCLIMNFLKFLFESFTLSDIAWEIFH